MSRTGVRNGSLGQAGRSAVDTPAGRRHTPRKGSRGEDGLAVRSTDTPPIDANVHASVLQMQERLREAHEVARLASWEWQPETGDVLVFQALAEAGMPAETLVPLEEWLAMVPVEEHEWVRGDFDA